MIVQKKQMLSLGVTKVRVSLELTVQGWYNFDFFYDFEFILIKNRFRINILIQDWFYFLFLFKNQFLQNNC